MTVIQVAKAHSGVISGNYTGISLYFAAVTSVQNSGSSKVVFNLWTGLKDWIVEQKIELRVSVEWYQAPHSLSEMFERPGNRLVTGVSTSFTVKRFGLATPYFWSTELCALISINQQ